MGLWGPGQARPDLTFVWSLSLSSTSAGGGGGPACHQTGGGGAGGGGLVHKIILCKTEATSTIPDRKTGAPLALGWLQGLTRHEGCLS